MPCSLAESELPSDHCHSRRDPCCHLPEFHTRRCTTHSRSRRHPRRPQQRDQAKVPEHIITKLTQRLYNTDQINIICVLLWLSINNPAVSHKCILMNETILPLIQSAPIATTMLFSFRKIYCQKIRFQAAAWNSKVSTNAHLQGHILSPEQPCQLGEYWLTVKNLFSQKVQNKLLQLTFISSSENAAHHGEMLYTCHAFSKWQVTYILNKTSASEEHNVTFFYYD